MKIYTDEQFSADDIPIILSAYDNKILKMMLKMPYYFRRFFIIEFSDRIQGDIEQGFIDLYLRDSCEEITMYIIKRPLKGVDGTNYLLVSHMLMDDSQVATDLYEAISDLSFKPSQPIEYDLTYNRENKYNSNIKEKTIEHLEDHVVEGFVNICDKSKTNIEKINAKVYRGQPSGIGANKVDKVEPPVDIDIAFLAE